MINNNKLHKWVCIAASLCMVPSIARADAAVPPSETPTLVKEDIIEEGVTGSYLSSRFARNTGDTDNAIRYLQKIYMQTPEDMNIAVQLQGLLLLQGRIDEALIIAEDIGNSDTKDGVSDLLLTLRAIKQNDLDSASYILKAVTEEGNVQLWVPLIAGWVSLKRQEVRAPLTAENITAEIGRAAPLVNYHLALINEQAGFADAAAVNLAAAIDNPAKPPTRVMSVLMDFYARNKKPTVLEPVIKAFFATHEQASLEIPPSIRTPEDGMAEVMYTMGGIMFGAGLTSDAAIYLQMALYIKPQMEEARLALGDTYAELGNYAESTQAYSQIEASSPNHLKAQLRTAVNYDRMNNLKGALHLLSNIANAYPDNVEALVTQGDLLRIHGSFQDAIHAYTKALERIPTLNSDLWPLFFARASCYDRLGQWQKAESDLQQALALKPDQPDVLNYLGFARLERGESLREVKELIARAVKARPNDAQIIDSMGWVLYKQGEYEEAGQYLEKALELLPNDPNVNDHLGDIYWRLGRKTEARYQWQRALSFSPEGKSAEALKRKIKTGLPESTAVTPAIHNASPALYPVTTEGRGAEAADNIPQK